MTIYGTLCYIIKDGKILLIKKSKSLFGEGKWNAPGGKLNPNEDPKEGVIREVFEETGLKINHPKNHGILTFYFGDKDTPAWIVHIFSTDSFKGKLKESDEGILKWLDCDKLPYEQMWGDDRYWIPLLLNGKSFRGDFYFDENAKTLLNHELEELN